MATSDFTPYWRLEVDGEINSPSKKYSSTHKVSIVDESIADSTTDQEMLITIDITALKVFMIWSTQNLTVEGNDGAGIAGTVALIANVAYLWTSDTYDTFKTNMLLSFSGVMASLLYRICDNLASAAKALKVSLFKHVTL